MVAAVIAAFASPRLEAERLKVETHPAPLLLELPGAAIDHGDEHVIKLTEAALREYARTTDTTLLVAAHRFRARVTRP